MLTEALGNKEHSGCTRGVGTFAPWKTGHNWTLEDKRASKKAKRDLYENKLRERIIAEVLPRISDGGTASVSELLPSNELHWSSCASRHVASATTDTDATDYTCDNIEVIKPLILQMK